MLWLWHVTFSDLESKEVCALKTTFFSLLTACALLVSCDPKNLEKEAAPRESAKSSAARVGVYAIDGTGAVVADNTIVLQFVNQSQASVKRYYEGAKIISNPISVVVEKAIHDVCADDKKAPFDRVVLLGYSWGAVGIQQVAGRLKAACGKPIPVRWIGLIDLVALGIEPSLDEANAARESINTRCFHVVKSNDANPLLGNPRTLSCEKKQVNADHRGIGKSAEALALLKADANKVSPDLFAGAKTSPLEAASANGKCSAKTVAGPASCLSSGCSWIGSLCTVTPK
jgi:hypothetical protein